MQGLLWTDVSSLLSAPPGFSWFSVPAPCSLSGPLINLGKQSSLCLAKAGGFGQQFSDRRLGKDLWYCSWCWKVCESFQRLSRDLGLQASVSISLFKGFFWDGTMKDPQSGWGEDYSLQFLVFPALYFQIWLPVEAYFCLFFP